jgi:two-component system LytT family response regulator
MNKIQTLVVDDEPLAREGILLLLKKDPEIEIIGECNNGRQAVKVLKDESIDLLFLDIQMPEMNGFQVLEDISSENMPVVIFVTAYNQYAIQAFKVHALNYLLKPFSDEQFYTALKHAKDYIKMKNFKELSKRMINLLENHSTDILGKEISQKDSKYINRIAISSTGRVYFIKVNEIEWIEASDYYVQLHTGNKTHLLRETMNNLETKLNPAKFMRIHRSTIVNLDCIQGIEPYFNGEYLVILNNGTKLKVSRNRKDSLKKILH